MLSLYKYLLLLPLTFILGCHANVVQTPVSSTVAVAVPAPKYKALIEDKITTPTDIIWRTVGRPAIVEASLTDRILVLQFANYEHCEPCRFMRDTTFKNKKIISMLNEDFVPVLADGEEYLSLMTQLEIKEWPATVFMRPDATVIGAFRGYIAPEVFVKMLESLIESKEKKPESISAPSGTQNNTLNENTKSETSVCKR